MNRSAVLVLSFLWLAQAAAAQQTQRDPQAVTVISQSLKAMGSSAAVQDTLAAGTIAMADGRSGTITIKSKGQGRLRHDINLDGKQLTYVVKGGTGYSVKNGKKSDLPLWVTQYQRPEHMPALSRLADYVSPYTKISYVGLEQVAGRAAYHIRLATVPQDGTPIEIEELISEFHVFLDKETLLVVKTQGYLFSPGCASEPLAGRNLLQRLPRGGRSTRTVPHDPLHFRPQGLRHCFQQRSVERRHP